MLNDLKELYSYRTMLVNLVKKDLRTRYKGSILGFLWTFVNPLLQLVVYSVVFSTIMRMDVENYPVFLFVGLVPWIFFSTSIQVSCSSMIANKDLVKKIYFPREIIPASIATAGLMNLLFSFIVVFIALIVTGVGISSSIIYLPIVIVVIYVLTLAISILFACLNVYFRDLEHMLGIIVMAWFYMTPIIFPVDMIPDRYLGIFFLNPMTTIISAFKDILYYKQAPNLVLLGITFLIGILLLIFSFKLFKILQRNFAEEI